MLKKYENCYFSKDRLLEERNEFRDSIDQSLIDLFLQLNHFPLLVPNTLVKNKNNDKLIKWLNNFKPED